MSQITIEVTTHTDALPENATWAEIMEAARLDAEESERASAEANLRVLDSDRTSLHLLRAVIRRHHSGEVSGPRPIP